MFIVWSVERARPVSRPLSARAAAKRANALEEQFHRSYLVVPA